MMVAAPHSLGLAARPHWRYTARQWAWAAVDVIFPPHCAGCEKVGDRFCADCAQSLQQLLPPICEICGYPTLALGQCATCRITLSALTGLRSVGFFEGPLQKAVHHLKYKRDIILADTLAQMFYQVWQTGIVPGDLVIPIPLSAKRLRERGYNQAGLLARGFAELARLPYAPAGAARMRHTASQVGLSAAKRRENVAGAFKADPRRVRGRSIILVDDVCTTGATLEACAEALRAAGAAQVWGFTLSRTR
jgi:competence protein ComFC